MTLSEIKELQKAGKIKGFKETRPEQKNGGRKVSRHFKKRSSKQKDWVAWNLWYWCNQKALQLEEEYYFARPDREFRFDWAIPSLMLAVEYEGSIFKAKGDHRSMGGLQRDIDKYQLAQGKGWRVLRFTALNYESLIEELNKYL